MARTIDISALKGGEIPARIRVLQEAKTVAGGDATKASMAKAVTIGGFVESKP